MTLTSRDGQPVCCRTRLPALYVLREEMKGPLTLIGLSLLCFGSLWGLKFVPGVYSEMSPLGFLIFGIGALGALLGLVGIIWGIVKLESLGKEE